MIPRTQAVQTALRFALSFLYMIHLYRTFVCIYNTGCIIDDAFLGVYAKRGRRAWSPEKLLRDFSLPNARAN